MHRHASALVHRRNVDPRRVFRATLDLSRRVTGQLRLLARDPDEFLRNIRQVTAPAAFLSQLLDTPEIAPLRLDIRPSASPPAFNVLLPLIAPDGMTGGPNTVLMIGARLARAGAIVRFISADQPMHGEHDWFWRHLEKLTGFARPRSATVADAATVPLHIGSDDLFIASFWTTAH